MMNSACPSSDILIKATESHGASDSSHACAKTIDERPFPNFKLSAELRNAIYSDILGGQVIHMRHSKNNEGKGWSGKVCSEPPSRHEPCWNLTGTAHRQYAGAKANGMVWDWGPVWEPCSSGTCPLWGAVKRRLQVQLLRVCRQVYSETASIIYEENVFNAFGRLGPGWPCLTSAFSTLQCRALANLSVTCCVTNLRRLPNLFPGLRRLFCELDSHAFCGCDLDDIFSNAVERMDAEAVENDKARWECICSQVEETCKLVCGMELVGVKVKLERVTWTQRFNASDFLTVERERWLGAKLENAFVARKDDSARKDKKASAGEEAELETTP